MKLKLGRYATHLILALAVKLLLLIALWNIFVKPHRVHVDSQAMAQRLTSQVSSAKEN
jgi:heme exporter protein D